MSGWALFSMGSGLPQAVGILRAPNSKIVLAKRLAHLQKDIESLFSTLNLKSGDMCICEGPAQLTRNPMSSLKLERVRGIFETVARHRSVLVPGRINPRTIQAELLGMSGKQVSRIIVKESAREVVRRLYRDILPVLAERCLTKRHIKKIPQDIIDALLLGALAVPRLQFCIKSGVDVHTAFLPRYQFRRTTPRRRVTGGWRQLTTSSSNRKLC